MSSFAAAAAADPGDEAAADLRARITRMYEAYNEEKLAALPGLLAKYAGKEAQLLGALVKKYGDEPEVSDAEESDGDEESDEDAAAWEWRLTRFYSKYNPDKVGDVEKTLAKYAGKEELLFAALVKKYGPEPEDAGGVADVAAAVAAASLGEGGGGGDDDEDDAEWTTRLTRFYALYNPEKVADVAKTLAKYAGNEDKLFDALVSKYGPEPPPPRSAGAGDGDGGDGADAADNEDATPFDANTSLFRAVAYCPHSGLPPEYTEYSARRDSCRGLLSIGRSALHS